MRLAFVSVTYRRQLRLTHFEPFAAGVQWESWQKAWCRSHMKRTWDGVRASAPAVQSTVLNMRNRAAVARAVVERRHRTQAADLIRIALRVSPQVSFTC